MRNGWALLEAPENPPLTNEMIEAWEQAEYQEEYQRAMFPQREDSDPASS